MTFCVDPYPFAANVILTLRVVVFFHVFYPIPMSFHTLCLWTGLMSPKVLVLPDQSTTCSTY